MSACRGQKDDSHPGNSELIRDGVGVRIVRGRLGSPLLHDTSCGKLLDISPVCSTLLGAPCFLTKWVVPVGFNLYFTCLSYFFHVRIFFWLWENMVNKMDFWIVLNWAPAFHYHRQLLTSWARCFQAGMLKAGTSLLEASTGRAPVGALAAAQRGSLANWFLAWVLLWKAQLVPVLSYD